MLLSFFVVRIWTILNREDRNKSHNVHAILAWALTISIPSSRVSPEPLLRESKKSAQRLFCVRFPVLLIFNNSLILAEDELTRRFIGTNPMLFMKKKLQSLLFAGILLAVNYADAWAQTLVLHHANGTTTDVELFTQPQVKFQDDKVLVTSTVLDIEYPKDDILAFTYKAAASGIQNLRGKTEMTQENGQLVFCGIGPSDLISVRTATGIPIPVTIRRRESTATLSLNEIPAGVYLVTVNGQTSKFTKR